MAQETAREPDGKDAAKTRDVGRPVRATARAATARAATRPDLDARNERMVGPRKPMGPPLKEPPAGLARRRADARSRRGRQTHGPGQPRGPEECAPPDAGVSQYSGKESFRREEDEELMAANDLRVFRNVGLPDASTSEATSTVGEPAVAVSGLQAYMTGNS